MAKYAKMLRKIKKTKALPPAAPLRGAAPEVVFFDFLSIFVYFANNPSHWDGNPGIGIVNPNNPKQSQFRQKNLVQVATPSAGRVGGGGIGV